MKQKNRSAPASETVTRLKNLLWRYEADESPFQVYAIVDAARGEGIYPLLAQETECQVVPLFRGELASELALVGPYLVVLDNDASLTDWLLSDGWGNSWGIFAVSDAPLEAVRRHFRSFLMVKDPDGKNIYFRYYDPRVLRIYLPTCNEEELGIFFGPVRRYVLEGGEKEMVIQYQAAGGELVVQNGPIGSL